MGIPNFLPNVEKTAGRLVDLREYKGRRIAIDISDWIQRECHANSEMLADENHLSNFGRATLLEQQHQEGHDDVEQKQRKEEAIQKYLQKVCTSVIDDLVNFQESTQSKILVVFDGATPPIKENTVQLRKRKRDDEMQERDRPVDVSGDTPGLERRYRANRRAGAGAHFLQVVDVIVESLRTQQIPFLVAPYEADGQLAFLQLHGLVDLVVTNDSDLIAYGPLSPVLYKIARDEEKKWTRGIIVRRNDLGAMAPGSKPSALSLLDLSPAMLAVFFTACGGDYCRKLQGIGVKSVAMSVREHFLLKSEPSEREEGDKVHPLGKVIQQIIAQSWESKNMSKLDKIQYEQDFIAAVFMYRHALVFDPIRGKCCTMTPLDQPDMELIGYVPYRDLVDCSDQHHKLIGKTFPPDIATYIAEGWICPKRMTLRQAQAIPDNVKLALQAFIALQQDDPMIVDKTVGQCQIENDDEDTDDTDIPQTTIQTKYGMASTSEEIEQCAPSKDLLETTEENDPEPTKESASDDGESDTAMETQER